MQWFPRVACRSMHGPALHSTSSCWGHSPTDTPFRLRYTSCRACTYAAGDALHVHASCIPAAFRVCLCSYAEVSRYWPGTKCCLVVCSPQYHAKTVSLLLLPNQHLHHYAILIKRQLSGCWSHQSKDPAACGKSRFFQCSLPKSTAPLQAQLLRPDHHQVRAAAAGCPSALKQLST